MKRFLTISGLVILNLLLIGFSVILYYGVTAQIIKTTDAPNAIAARFVIPLVFAGLLIFLMNRTFRRLGIGLTAVFISGLLFLVFYLNRNFASEGEFKSIQLGNACWVDDKYYLDIAFNKWGNSIEVTQEKCFKVDSVQVRVDKGFFGFGTLTNQVRIVESSNCEQEYFDSSDVLKSHLGLANKLAQKRCFPAAIHHYSLCIEIDSLNPDYHYSRGNIYMVIEDYDKALVDFVASALRRYRQLDNETIESIKNIEPAAYTKELFDKVDRKNFDGISEYLQNLTAIDDFDTYYHQISFCLEKIKEK